ncbi:uncharacterized protein ACIQIH_000653 isoform 2-T4 [Cyanocitta cristata]
MSRAQARARPRARRGKRGAWPAAPPAPPPYREWNAGAGPPPQLNPVTSAGKAGGAERAQPSRASRTGNTVSAAAGARERPVLPLQRRAATGEALSVRLWSRSPDVRAWKRFGRAEVQGWAERTPSESVGRDEGTVFAQVTAFWKKQSQHNYTFVIESCQLLQVMLNKNNSLVTLPVLLSDSIP